MSSTFYDPDVAPHPGDWLALPESERIRVAKEFHVQSRIKTPNPKGHAAFHVVVENQIAMGFGPSCRAIERLQKQGLRRHDAIHAIGSAVASFLHEDLTAQGAEPIAMVQSRMNAAIERLSAKAWMEGGNG